MIQKRRFIVFYLYRWGIVILLLLVSLTIIGEPFSDQLVLILPLVGVSAFISYLEHDSLPTQIGLRQSVFGVDPSGQEFAIEKFAHHQFLWMHRYSYVREGRLQKLPSEAFPGIGTLFQSTRTT